MVFSKPSYPKLWPQQLEKQELTWHSARTRQNKNNCTFTVQIPHFVNRETTFPEGREEVLSKYAKYWVFHKELFKYVNKEQIDEDYRRGVQANIIISSK